MLKKFQSLQKRADKKLKKLHLKNPMSTDNANPEFLLKINLSSETFNLVVRAATKRIREANPDLSDAEIRDKVLITLLTLHAVSLPD